MAVDLGTQSIRIGLYDLKGRMLSEVGRKYKTYYPLPGWAEQDPRDWWKAFIGGARETMSRFPNVAILAIAVSATSSTVLPVDHEGNPLNKAIIWMDVRATEQTERINKARHPILKWCGGEVSAEWLLPKVLWFKEKRPEIYEKACLIVEAIDWFNYKLTGRWVGSQCNASCKWNYLPGEGWSKDFLEAIGLAELGQKVPSEILPVGTVIGFLEKDVAREIGCDPGIPVAQGGIDAHTSMIGLGNFEEGEVSLVLDSSSVFLMNVNFSSVIPGFWGPYKDPLYQGVLLLEGGQVSSGSILNWLVEKIAKQYISEAQKHRVTPFDLLDTEASKIPPGANGLIVLDHWQGNRTPYKDPYSRGIIWGLTMNHEVPHIARAIYEGTSFGIRLFLDYLKEKNILVRKIKVCGGGTRSHLWTRILADVCEQPLKVTLENMTLLGSAIVAACSVDAFHSFEEGFLAMQPEFEVISPQYPFSEYQKNYEHYCKLYQISKKLICRGE